MVKVAQKQIFNPFISKMKKNANNSFKYTTHRNSHLNIVKSVVKFYETFPCGLRMHTFKTIGSLNHTRTVCVVLSV